MALGENAWYERLMWAFLLFMLVYMLLLISFLKESANTRKLILQELDEIKKMSQEIRCYCIEILQKEKLNSRYAKAEITAESDDSDPDVDDLKSKTEIAVVDEKSILENGSLAGEDIGKSNETKEAKEQEGKHKPINWSWIISHLFDYVLAVIMAVAFIRYLLRQHVHI